MLTFHDILLVILSTMVFASFLLIFYFLTRHINLNKALKEGESLPPELLLDLSNPSNCREVDYDERLSFAQNSLLKCLAAYLLVTAICFIHICEKSKFHIDRNCIIVAAAVGVLVLLIWLKDLLITLPRLKVYRLKAVRCLPVLGLEGEYICYYDFIKKELASGYIGPAGLFGFEYSKERVFYIWAVAKRNRLKVMREYYS